MKLINDLISNYVLASAFFSWLAAQVIKVALSLFEKPRRNIFKVLFSTGGMPSSHTSAVIGLSLATLVSEGAGSAAFAITVIFAGVVMIDASGVRYETGKQSVIIKQMAEKIFSDDAQSINAGLKELVGHTPFQVVMGAVLGVAVGLLTGLCMGAI